MKKAPLIGNGQVNVYTYIDGENKLTDTVPVQSLLNDYWGFVKDSNDPIKDLLDFLCLKSSYKTYKLVENKNVSIAIEYLKEQNFKELKIFTNWALQKDENNMELLKLSGIAYASLNEPLMARKRFLKVLLATPKNRDTLVNYVTACFQDGDGTSALKMIELNLKLFKRGDLHRLADSINEAISCKVIEISSLPSSFYQFFSLNC